MSNACVQLANTQINPSEVVGSCPFGGYKVAVSCAKSVLKQFSSGEPLDFQRTHFFPAILTADGQRPFTAKTEVWTRLFSGSTVILKLDVLVYLLMEDRFMKYVKRFIIGVLALGVFSSKMSILGAQDSAPVQGFIQGSEEEVLRLLQDKAVDIHSTISFDNHAFPLGCLLAERGFARALKYLARADLSCLSEPIGAGVYEGQAPAHIAAIFGRVSVLEYLKSVNVGFLEQPVVHGDTRGLAPVHFAAATGHVNVLEYLRTLNLDLLEQPILTGGDQGFTPAHMAAVWGFPNVLEYLKSVDPALLEQLVVSGAYEGLGLVHLAAVFGQTNILKYLQAIKPTLFQQPVMNGPHKGLTPVDFAAKNGRTAVVAYLQGQKKN